MQYGACFSRLLMTQLTSRIVITLSGDGMVAQTSQQADDISDARKVDERMLYAIDAGIVG
jgi:acetolactate synthase small subunit